MTVVTILLGIVGLGIIVFIHELGHFLAAKACGVDVEAFSLGWGKKLLAFTPKGSRTEYRISLVPLGGYCKMRGEEEVQAALEKKLPDMPRDKGTYYGAPWWQRTLIALAGPGANAIFAAIALTLVAMIGYDVTTWPAKIRLPERDATAAESGMSPAERAGLRTGDVILEIGGEAIEHYGQVREQCSVKPGETLSMTVLRDGLEIYLSVTPRLDKSSGAGIIGVLPFIDAVVGAVAPDSQAEAAGLRRGDRILAANGEKVESAFDLEPLIAKSKPKTLELAVDRAGEAVSVSLPIKYLDAGHDPFGISWDTVTWKSPRHALPEALARGFARTGESIVTVVKGLGLLFSGIDVSNAVSGPIAITMLTGEIAMESFGSGLSQGISVTLNFLALISVALFVMNLLPIPLLDGGQIVTFLVEAFRGKPLSPRALLKYQAVGMAIVLTLIVLVTANDVLKLIFKA